jgi:ubiquinone/menaquinone biosynthesis C-methylase UbiE
MGNDGQREGRKIVTNPPLDLSANVERFQGFAAQYDAYRPQPPTIILDILTQLAQVDRPRQVVDLGSGTGLSTRIWGKRAQQVIGIEPSDDMRRQAEAHTDSHSNVRYQAGFSTATGLPDNCTDIVTCSQSLHWMEPNGTFAEVARILRPGGVFAAYDCDWPATMHWEAELAENAFMERVGKLDQERGFSREVRRWRKEEHLARLQASGRFRYAKEVVVHSVEQGNAERLIGLALSQGVVMTLIKNGLGEDEIGLTTFREVTSRALGTELRPWYFSYRIRLAVK